LPRDKKLGDLHSSFRFFEAKCNFNNLVVKPEMPGFENKELIYLKKG
jgi:hypothetical protein